jgi:hypothetical protein
VRDTGDEIRSQARQLGLAPKLYERHDDETCSQRQQADNERQSLARQTADHQLARGIRFQRYRERQRSKLPRQLLARRVCRPLGSRCE